jgi:putative tricarboxylic transport membrane protein
MTPTNPGAGARVSPRFGTHIAVAVGVLLLGAALGFGTLQLPVATGYAKIGPRLMPTLVTIGLLALGAVLLKDALTGGFRGIDEEEEAAKPTHWPAFAWISGAMILNGALMVHAGFVIAGALMFVLAARAFGDRRWALNLGVGLLIAAATYAGFNFGLGLNLPRGILPI